MVYLGWKWVGTLADEWYIDDVEVRSLGPDLEISVTPQVDPIVVGEEVPVSILIKNHTNAEAKNIGLEFVFPEGGAVYDGEAIMIDSLAALSETQVDVLLTLDADLNPNRYLPIVVHAESDEGDWSLDTSLLIGYPSLARFSVEALEPSFLQVEVAPPGLACDIGGWDAIYGSSGRRL